MKIKILIIFFLSILISKLYSNETENDNSYIIISLAQDPSFGFYPFINGGFQIAENKFFTYYGIFWTQDALAGNQGGIGLLTEFGIGLNFSFLDGNLNINPSLGLGNGKFQSGGARYVIGDNIVPAIYFNVITGQINHTIGFIYWKGLRREELIDKYRDQIQYFYNLWYQINKNIDLGLYYDHFLLKEEDKYINSTNTIYHWIGPSIKFKTKSIAELWFSCGFDLYQYTNGLENPSIKDFYKLVFSLKF